MVSEVVRIFVCDHLRFWKDVRDLKFFLIHLSKQPKQASIKVRQSCMQFCLIAEILKLGFQKKIKSP